jgi:hypothetical protein
LTVQPGEQNQTVTVTEAIPVVETTNATLGGTLSNATINDLPLNGRNYQNLLGLRPGVMIQPGGSPWTQSTNNIRPDETGWMIDGVINSNFYDARPVVNAPSAFTDAATIMPIDAIQEFNLEENPKAEYGWKPGAVVNVGIRSGTNTLHGSAYAFGRDNAWDARNVFNPAPQDKLPTELKQFGAVIGGPIRKDKLFFFAGYEGLRSTVGNVFAGSVPATASLGDPGASMVDAINALQANLGFKGLCNGTNGPICLSPVSMKLVGCTTGPVACTGGYFPNSPTGNYTSTFPNINNSDNGVAKIDYRINSKHMINGMMWTGAYTAVGEDHAMVNTAFLSTLAVRTWTIVGNWIYTPTSTLVNEARFGYDRATNNFGLNDAKVLPDGSGLTGGNGYPINTGVTAVGGLPYINIQGFFNLGSWRGRPDTQAPNPYWDLQDSVSYLRGKHAFKFGGEFAHIEADRVFGDYRGRFDFRGSKTFSGSTNLEDFLAGNPARSAHYVGSGSRTLTWRSYAGFVQDDWRIVPKLMLNLGLRYEYRTPMKEINGLFGNFDPALGLVQQGQSSVGNTLWKPDHKNFSPRVGFAWDVTGKGTTVVRGGASIIYSSFVAASFIGNPGAQNVPGGTSLSAVPTGACTTTPTVVGAPCPQTYGGTIQFANVVIPRSQVIWNAPAGSSGVFPAGAVVSCTTPNPCPVAAIDPNLKTPYVVNWNLGVQHAFTNNLSLDVGYVGNHGGNLLGIRDINQPDLVTGVLPFAKFSYLSFINENVNDALSNYNSLQTTLTERLSHGLDFTAGYTYGHGLDNGSLNRFGGLPQDSTNPRAEYASGDFDVRHRFTFTAGYALPGRKGFGQMLQGWKVNSIVTIESPQPWTVNDTGNDFSHTGEGTDRWDFFGNPNDFKSGGAHALPYCTGPGAGGCTQFDGISGVTTSFSPSASTAMWGQCTAVAPDPNTLAGNAALNIPAGGCVVSGNSVMVPPKFGTFGTMGRNTFRDLGFKNVDFSVFKDFKFTERFGAQFRFEVFNLFNHPIYANPYGGVAGNSGQNDPSVIGTFGCGCSTPDVQAGNPIIGSGGARDIQIGLKLTF